MVSFSCEALLNIEGLTCQVTAFGSDRIYNTSLVIGKCLVKSIALKLVKVSKNKR